MEANESFELSAFEESFSEDTKAKSALYSCQNCNFASYKSSLRRHNSRKHKPVDLEYKDGSKKMYMCDQCGRHFYSYTGMKSLIRTVHTMEFRYKCSVCDRGFDGKYNYKGHLAAHLNVTREKFSRCSATYQYKKNLVKHMASEHDNQSYICDTCNQNFSTLDTLREHMDAQHKGRTFACKFCGKQYKWRSSLWYHNAKCYVQVSSLSK